MLFHFQKSNLYYKQLHYSRSVVHVRKRRCNGNVHSNTLTMASSLAGGQLLAIEQVEQRVRHSVPNMGNHHILHAHFAPMCFCQ